MMDGSIDTVAFQMKEIYQTLQSTDHGNYMRIDAPQAARHYAADISDASPGNIAKLKDAGNKTLADAQTKGLDKFLDGLLDS